MRQRASVFLVLIGMLFLAGCGNTPTPAGPTIHEFPLPLPNSSAGEITAGPDGNLWFIEIFSNRIGRITPAGQITEFPLPAPADLSDYDNLLATITAGPDGNLWFTEDFSSHIWRITPAGQITQFPLPAGSIPAGITAGPDGNLWFTDEGTNQIGRITPAGRSANFLCPRLIAAQCGSPPGRMATSGLPRDLATRLGASRQPGRLLSFPCRCLRST